MRLSRNNARQLKSIGRSAYKVTDKAVTGLFRFATTDHTGISQRLCNMPKMGFLESLKYILFQMLLTIVAAIVTAAFTFLLIAYGIPFLIFVLQ
jgi:hypothetical protein